MKLNPILLAIAAVAPLSGCTVGLPHGPIEPSITADCVAYLHENWIGPLQGQAPVPTQTVAQDPAPHAPLREPQPIATAEPAPAPREPTATDRSATKLSAPEPAALHSVAAEPIEAEPVARQEADSDRQVSTAACAACECGAECHDCPLIPNVHLPHAAQPMYVDPGPPGRFLPVPVQPVFSPRPEMGYFQPMPAAY